MASITLTQYCPNTGDGRPCRLDCGGLVAHGACSSSASLHQKYMCLCRDAPAGRFSIQLWRQHVLANLPMYSMLLPLYLDLARSRVSSRCEETLIDLRRVRSGVGYDIAGACFSCFAGFACCFGLVNAATESPFAEYGGHSCIMQLSDVVPGGANVSPPPGCLCRPSLWLPWSCAR